MVQSTESRKSTVSLATQANYFFFFFLVVKQPVVLQSYWSLDGTLDTVPLLSLTCPLRFPSVLAVLLNDTIFLASLFILLDATKASGQKWTELDDEEQEEDDDEEVDSGRWWRNGALRTILGDKDETRLGGWGGVRCLTQPVGGGIWFLLATINPWSLSTTSTNKLRAWAFSSTLYVMSSVAATILCPRWRTSSLVYSIVLATLSTADLSSSMLCCLLNVAR